MLKILVLVLGFSLFCTVGFGQNYFTVTAPSGLSLRSQASSSSSKVGSLRFLENVELMERSSKFERLVDNKESVEGEWLKVKGEEGEIGFAFGHYLTRKWLSPSEEYIECDPGFTCNTLLTNDQVSFKATFYDYQVEHAFDYETGGLNTIQPWDQHGDTLQVYEYVFNEISDKLIQLVPKGDVDSLQLWISYQESIRSAELYWEKEEINRSTDSFYWSGKMPYQSIELKNGFARIPPTNYGLIEYRREQFGMEDCNIDLGEGWIDANLMLQDKPCIYTVESALLKVIPFVDGKPQKEEVIEIVLSYGC